MKPGVHHLDYQLAIPAPAPPRGSFNPPAAERGQTLFAAKAQCARCHLRPDKFYD